MPFMDFLFSPQAHKFRNGYFINHDTLLQVKPELRPKLIFYFIAEQVPQKLETKDRELYQSESVRKMGIPRTLCMTAAFVAPLTWGVLKRRAQLFRPKTIAYYLIWGGISMPFASALYTRLFEASFVSGNSILDKLSQKYNFGVYDFSVAKKQAHVLKLLDTMDFPYSHKDSNDLASSPQQSDLQARQDLFSGLITDKQTLQGQASALQEETPSDEEQ